MSNIAALYDAPDMPLNLTRPLLLALVVAGFPSPADDHLDRDLDLHELLIQHPAAKKPALGFAMGDPYHLHREKLPRHGVEVFSSNYALYGDMSRRVMATLADHTPEIELSSIDEAFLNLAGFERRGLVAYTQRIRGY